MVIIDQSQQKRKENIMKENEKYEEKPNKGQGYTWP